MTCLQVSELYRVQKDYVVTVFETWDTSCDWGKSYAGELFYENIFVIVELTENSAIILASAGLFRMPTVFYDMSCIDTLIEKIA